MRMISSKLKMAFLVMIMVSPTLTSGAVVLNT